VLRDRRDPPGYHPARDQVTAVAVRPLAGQVFRWQQRLQEAAGVALRWTSRRTTSTGSRPASVTFLTTYCPTP
jgi:hypothetical protein